MEADKRGVQLWMLRLTKVSPLCLVTSIEAALSCLVKNGARSLPSLGIPASMEGTRVRPEKNMNRERVIKITRDYTGHFCDFKKMT